MNPRVSLLVLITILFISCSTDTKEAVVVAVPESKNLISETDTFYGGGNLLAITDTSETVFSSLYNFKRDTSEKNNIKKDVGFVSRSGDTLYLKLDNGGVKKLRSDRNMESEDFSSYDYIGKINSINYYLIFVSGNEWSSYLMVNIKTGKETDMCGMPAISPNKKYLVSSRCDLQARFDFNGIQMYDIGNDSLIPNWSRELNKWGADELTWMNDHTLVAKKLSIDTTNSNLVTSYIKLSCIGK